MNYVFNNLTWDHINRLHNRSLFLARSNQTFLPQSISFRRNSLNSLRRVVFPAGPDKIFHQCQGLHVERMLRLPGFEEHCDLEQKMLMYKKVKLLKRTVQT